MPQRRLLLLGTAPGPYCCGAPTTTTLVAGTIPVDIGGVDAQPAHGAPTIPPANTRP